MGRWWEVTGLRDWARIVFGPEMGDRMADDFAGAIGRELDAATFYGTETPPMSTPDPPTPGTHHLSEVIHRTFHDATPDAAANDPERLGLIVGAAYGNALAERDQARDLAATLGARLAEALTHLEAVLAASPVVSTFAHDDDTLTSARQFLADAVESSGTPEQEV